MEKRARGRPGKDGSTVGKAHLLEGIRKIARINRRPDLSRKGLARQLGITPALISYYFPRKDSMIIDVAAPVLWIYLQRLKVMIGTPKEPSSRLRDVIGLLAELYGKDANILDLYKQEAIAFPENSLVVEMSDCLIGFFNEWRGSQREDVCCFDAAVLQGALWGMSEFLTRLDSKTTAAPDVICDRRQRELHEFFRSWITVPRDRASSRDP